MEREVDQIFALEDLTGWGDDDSEAREEEHARSLPVSTILKPRPVSSATERDHQRREVSRVLKGALRRVSRSQSLGRLRAAGTDESLALPRPGTSANGPTQLTQPVKYATVVKSSTVVKYANVRTLELANHAPLWVAPSVHLVGDQQLRPEPLPPVISPRDGFGGRGLHAMRQLKRADADDIRKTTVDAGPLWVIGNSKHAKPLFRDAVLVPTTPKQLCKSDKRAKQSRIDQEPSHVARPCHQQQERGLESNRLLKPQRQSLQRETMNQLHDVGIVTDKPAVRIVRSSHRSTRPVEQ